MNDWNHDGKKDGVDNFIEYQIYEDTAKNSIQTYNIPTRRENNPQQGMSIFGAILCVLSGLFWQALLFTLLNVDIRDLPSFLLIIIWIAFSTITAGIVNAIRKK